jgi:hypothetical protein
LIVIAQERKKTSRPGWAVVFILFYLDDENYPITLGFVVLCGGD